MKSVPSADLTVSSTSTSSLLSSEAPLSGDDSGWCLMELGVSKARPILYSAGDGLRDDALHVFSILMREDEGEKRAGLKKLFRFEAAGFSVESDRAIVRWFIHKARGNVGRFEAFLVNKVIEDLDYESDED